MTRHTDRIEKKILLRARQFGTWFGVEFDGEFVAGARLTGKITPTKVDPEVAKSQQPYSGKAFEIEVDRIEPMRLLSFRWHPFAVEPGLDYSKEPATLVAFELEPAAGGTMLTITESGFDRIPLARRAKAFAANDQGWLAQTKLLEKYLARTS